MSQSSNTSRYGLTKSVKNAIDKVVSMGDPDAVAAIGEQWLREQSIQLLDLQYALVPAHEEDDMERVEEIKAQQGASTLY